MTAPATVPTLSESIAYSISFTLPCFIPDSSTTALTLVNDININTNLFKKNNYYDTLHLLQKIILPNYISFDKTLKQYTLNNNLFQTLILFHLY